VIAVTEDIGLAFDRYRADSGKRKQWSGVSKPPDSKVLATVRVVRDDSASMFSFMEDVYNEYTSAGTVTGA
jgi:hypothetical protein